MLPSRRWLPFLSISLRLIWGQTCCLLSAMLVPSCPNQSAAPWYVTALLKLNLHQWRWVHTHKTADIIMHRVAGPYGSVTFYSVFVCVFVSVCVCVSYGLCCKGELCYTACSFTNVAQCDLTVLHVGKPVHERQPHQALRGRVRHQRVQEVVEGNLFL